MIVCTMQERDGNGTLQIDFHPIWIPTPLRRRLPLLSVLRGCSSHFQAACLKQRPELLYVMGYKGEKKRKKKVKHRCRTFITYSAHAV